MNPDDLQIKVTNEKYWETRAKRLEAELLGAGVCGFHKKQYEISYPHPGQVAATALLFPDLPRGG